MLTDAPSHHARAFQEASNRARRLGRPVLASWTEPTTLDPLSFFAQHASSVDRGLWLRPSSGEALVGVGAARTLTARGGDRFKQIAEQWRDLLADAVLGDTAPASACGGPRLLGGFSFDPARRQSSARWSAFPDASLVLPDRMLVAHDGATWLTRNVVVAPDAGHLEPPARTLEPVAAGEQPPLSAKRWRALVGSVAAGIRDGQLGLHKVVLARAEQFQLRRPIDLPRALSTLAEVYPGCTVFAIARATACFLGATPERLIALRRGAASTLALAGSGPRGGTPEEDRHLADQLLQDPKERAEHAYVVAAIRQALAEVSTRVVSDTRPRLKQLSNVQHLLTPIRAQVSPGTQILDLVERLHPTPAVGGVPTQRALELIRECEGLDRGWYAGPIGWVDDQGDGEFVVGIRSALLHPDSATLFAGCGIVADSDPVMEYAESVWKLQPMLAALGLPR